MFNLNEIKTTDRQATSPYITYGSGQVLRINDIELKNSPNTGSPKAILYMETKPIEDPNFTPAEGAKGRIGKVAIGVYMKTDEQKLEFLRKLKTIAQTIGVEDEVNEIKGNSFEDVVTSIKKVISGGNKYARYTIFGEQYQKISNTNGQPMTGVKLFLPRYNFVESLDVEESKSRLIKFDENNPQHFKKIVPKQNENVANDEGLDDLPF